MINVQWVAGFMGNTKQQHISLPLVAGMGGKFCFCQNTKQNASIPMGKKT